MKSCRQAQRSGPIVSFLGSTMPRSTSLDSVSPSPDSVSEGDSGNAVSPGSGNTPSGEGWMTLGSSSPLFASVFPVAGVSGGLMNRLMRTPRLSKKMVLEPLVRKAPPRSNDTAPTRGIRCLAATAWLKTRAMTPAPISHVAARLSSKEQIGSTPARRLEPLFNGVFDQRTRLISHKEIWQTTCRVIREKLIYCSDFGEAIMPLLRPELAVGGVGMGGRGSGAGLS